MKCSLMVVEISYGFVFELPEKPMDTTRKNIIDTVRLFCYTILAQLKLERDIVYLLGNITAERCPSGLRSWS